MKKLIKILVITLTVFNCSTEDSDSYNFDTSTTLIAKGNLLGAGSEGIHKQNMIIRNSLEWETLKMRIANTTASFTETEIDFTNYLIIAVFDEVKLGSGYSIELDVTYNTDNIFVNIIEVISDGDLTTRYTQPFHIIKLDATDLPILFQ